MIEEDLRDLVRATAASTAVGTAVDWDESPQGVAEPRIVLHRITGAPGMGMKGPDSTGAVIVQLDLWARSPTEAVTLARSFKAALNGYKITPFQGIFLEDEREADDAEAPEGIYGRSLDLRVWHNVG